MSDDFIPLNQSTPVQGGRQHGNGNLYPRNYQQNRFQNNSGSWTPKRGGYSNRGQTSRNHSFGSDANSSHGGDNRPNIDAFLHPSMLQNPWAKLQQNRTA